MKLQMMVWLRRFVCCFVAVIIAESPRVRADEVSDSAVEKILSTRIFGEPLVSVGRNPTSAESFQLADALERHVHRSLPDDFSALEEFLARHPNSAWSPALTFDLGMEFYNTGWYSKALACWENAWRVLKTESDPAAKILGDRAAGELAYMYGRLGRMAELETLLDSVKDRVFIGPATEKIAGARQGLWTMRNRPEVAFRCGPFALDRILTMQRATNAGCEIIRNAASTTNGTSLSEVSELSRKLGINFQMAYRDKGAPLLMPAVVNWKVGHYAALLREENGLHLLQDPTFGNDAWVSRRALEAEASGYFLVPPGDLPAGWRAVSEAEGKKVFGKGSTANSDPDATTPDDKTSGCPDSTLPPMPYNGIRGMAVADAHLMVVSLHLQDAPVGYRPPVGPPIYFVASYSQREAGQPGSFNYSNLGSKWTFNWLAYIKDNPSALSADVSYYTDGGGSLPFTDFNTNTQTFASQLKNQALLKRTSTNGYEMSFRDGSKIIFALPDSVGGTSRRVFMTQKIDPRGNSVQISYDGTFRITGVTDAIGQVTAFSYEHPSDSRKITKVTDPFGRFALFSYDGNNRLAQITDVIGLTSQFTYDSGDFIHALTTSYGTSTFEKGENGRQRWLVITRPNGEKERVEYNEYNAITGVTAGDPAAEVPSGMGVANNYLNYRNSFYWDRKAYAAGPSDYTKAHLYHWQHYGNLSGGIVESEKAPLENRVWYTYDGQGATYATGTSDQPKAIGRVLDDGTTQLRRFSYDSGGNITNTMDARGRTVSFIYATNLVDLLEVRQITSGNNDLLARFIYNTQHLAIASMGASAQWTTNTYNARGQLTSSRNPLGEINSFNYDANGYLLSVDRPLAGTNDSLRFTYDGFGRVRTMGDSDGFFITNSYDNLDRLTNMAFPDGTFAAFTYDKLDQVKSRDRSGREVTFTYDSLRRMTSMRDALNRALRFEYCDCGSLSALIDPMGRATRWEYDLQGRVTAKQFPDGSRTLYTYENTTSRLKTIRDELGQVTSYEYFPDDLLRRVSYPTAQVATPAVSFTYDANYPRMIARTDGLGTTSWTYQPVGAFGAMDIASVDGPWANDTVTFQYDALGRQTNRAINGVAQALAYDAAGRIISVTNALGNFTSTYDGVTERVLDLSFPNGQTSHFDYFGNAGDRRIQRITHRKPDNSLISQFTYDRSVSGNITNWLQELGSATNEWSIGYDVADRLINVMANQSGSNIASTFAYDRAGNRLAESVGGTNREFLYNALNQLSSSSDTTLTNSSYEWDAAHRLVAIVSGAQRTEFGYDGQGRRCRIVEKTNNLIQSERRYVWCGTELCEERDASDTVLRRFFGQGFTVGSAKYFYTRDHLRSVREVVDAAGQVQSRYAYAPFGAPTALQENVASPFGFAGYFRHQSSGLSLTLFRPYSSGLGRWLSRDPLAESAGANLYAYVGNDPINSFDSLGLCGTPSTSPDPSGDSWQKFKQDFFDLSKVTGAADAMWGTSKDLLQGLGQLLPDGNAFRGAFDRLPDAKWLGNLDLALNAADLMDNPTLGKTISMGLSLVGDKYPPIQWFNRGMTFGQLGTQSLYDYAVGQVGQDAIDLTLADWGDNWFWQGVNRASDILSYPVAPWGH